MRRLVISCFAVVATVAVITASFAAGPPKTSNLVCFSGGGGSCAIDKTNNSAVLTNQSGGAFSGVYVNGKSYSNKPLASVDFAFDYYSQNVSGGSPRLSIPINDGTSPTPYAFIDAAGCGYASDPPNVTQFHTVGTSSGCAVTFKGTTYTNWDAFAAANPTLKISNGTLAFVIADQPGQVVVYRVSTTSL